jgi:hypothetical protein
LGGNINLINKTMITKVTFMAFDKQCEMLFTDKSEVEIKADLYLLCSTYVILNKETITEEDIQAEDLPF